MGPAFIEIRRGGKLKFRRHLDEGDDDATSYVCRSNEKEEQPEEELA
jgi:hypothetical protein